MKTKHYSLAAALAAFLLLSSLYLNSFITPVLGGAQGVVPVETAGISSDRYMQDVTYLASDELRGRASGSPELEKAGNYIAEQFRASGLQPAGDNGTYFQTFEITTGTEFGKGNRLQLDQTSLESGKDFVPIPFSTSAEVDAPIIFAGYGITAPELSWDDYQGIDATGKVVLVFRHEPQELDPNSKFGGTNFTAHASFVNKAINARQHGAKGIIFITDPANHLKDADEVGAATKGIEGENIGIASFHARQTPFVAAFAKAGKNLTAIQQSMDQNFKPESFDLPGVRIRMATDIIRIRKPVRNVIAAISGSDPTLQNEWLVIGAHYDHLGVGDSHSLAPSQIGQIHHGADDNASGTSGVLELARLAARNRQSFKRSVLFMTFAGEELGLLGSANFVNHPTIPLDKVVGMLNLDMIGRLKNDQLFMGGVGTSPNFRAWLEGDAMPLGLKLEYSESASGGSDHMSFNQKRIPILFFFTGLHADYHRPSDTSDKINAPGAVRVLNLVYGIAGRIANEPARVQYTEVRESRPAGGGGSGAASGYGPYFGSVPDFRDDLNGVLFADVRPDSPAGKAGLIAGDLMIEFNGKEIRNLYDFTYALQAAKVGDVVVVGVQRGGKTVKVNVTLEAQRVMTTLNNKTALFVFILLGMAAGLVAAQSIAPHAKETHLRNIQQLTNGGENAGAYFSADGKQIVFQSTREPYKCDQIFTMKVDGSEVKRVSSGAGRTTCAYFTPDGSRVIYASTHLGSPDCPPVPSRAEGYVWPIYKTFDIFSAKPDGTDLKRLTNTVGYDAEGVISPDGKKLLFTSARDSDLELYEMNIDGSSPRRLTNALGYDGGAFYSQDGQWIVWRANRPRTPEEIKQYKDLFARDLVMPLHMEIMIMKADGTQMKQLTANGAGNFAPYFHPNGRQIIFASDINNKNRGIPNFDLFMINRDGTGLEQVTFDESFDAFPMFTNDGKKLIWASNRHEAKPGETNVFLADWVQ